MVALYVTSTETFSGKTAVCIGLGRRLQHEGYKVGYFKPMSFTARLEEQGALDEDSHVIQKALGIKDPLDAVCPVLITPRVLERIIRGQAPDLVGRIKEAYAQISRGKDVVIIEGANNLAVGSLIDFSGIEALEAFDAKGVVVERYRDDMVIDHLLIAKRVGGDRAVGAVINTVPINRMEFVEKDVRPFCEKRGIKVFAILPQDRFLLSTSVGELVEYLNGEVLCCQDRMDELVENLMVGAMSVDSALKYFRRKANKAVITGGDRPDIQLAALETSTKCVILTGNMQPNPIILGRAEELGVPMILVRQDTLSTVECVEQVFGKVRFHDEKKIAKFEATLNERFDYAELYATLGLAPQSGK
ncbi:MAG: phosphotransacetylase family protein [Chloroflexi bacterium]|nr:phosphotransacetylase family protein [Chloroflexota bacterium]